jgi:hypothetical protein
MTKKATTTDPEPQLPPLAEDPPGDHEAKPNGEMPTAPDDVFENLDKFRLRQSFDKVTVRRPLTTVSIRKPNMHEWFQTHPSYQYEATLFQAKEEGLGSEWYFPTNQEILGTLEELSPKGVKDTCIFWWINRKKNTCIWPVVLADADGRQNDWHASMYEMLSVHGRGEHWCRIESADGGYNPAIADTEGWLPPEWPTVQKFGDVLRVAFKKGGRTVDSLDHPLIQRLRG